jgi:cyclohexa-1,5-dienecarbonyl-CoA hydratase
MPMSNPVSLAILDDGAWWRVGLGGSKGNILDGAAMRALTAVLVDAYRAPGLKAIILQGDGANFSFGASVQEHLPDQVEGMLETFRSLMYAIVESPVAVLAVVRGHCLGGALEVVTVCHRVFASRDARLGQPEIALGVFAPAASVVLAERVGRAHAEDLCLTGRLVGADEALSMGLVDEVSDDPTDLALAWARANLTSRSASSLRLAVRAIRADLATKVRAELPRAERLYVNDLMKTADALEGLRAFIERRPPVWRDA